MCGFKFYGPNHIFTKNMTWDNDRHRCTELEVTIPLEFEGKLLTFGNNIQLSTLLILYKEYVGDLTNEGLSQIGDDRDITFIVTDNSDPF